MSFKAVKLRRATGMNRDDDIDDNITVGFLRRAGYRIAELAISSCYCQGLQLGGEKPSCSNPKGLQFLSAGTKWYSWERTTFTGTTTLKNCDDSRADFQRREKFTANFEFLAFCYLYHRETCSLWIMTSGIYIRQGFSFNMCNFILNKIKFCFFLDLLLKHWIKMLKVQFRKKRLKIHRSLDRRTNGVSKIIMKMEQ